MLLLKIFQEESLLLLSKALRNKQDGFMRGREVNLLRLEHNHQAQVKEKNLMQFTQGNNWLPKQIWH